jgi:hypothetical protein
MTEAQALEIVKERRKEIGIDPEMRVSSAERAIVEYKKDPDEPGPTEDRVAWIIQFSCEWGYAVVHVEDRTGEILTVKGSA